MGEEEPGAVDATVSRELFSPGPTSTGWRRHIWATTLVLVALLSIFILQRVASSPQVLNGVRDTLDEQQATVAALAASATGLSAVLSLVPGDALSPTADQLAGVSGWFVVVIAAIILQKILITVSGSVAFTIIVPLACLLGIAFVYSRKDGFRSLAMRFAAFALILCAAVPGSILVSTALTSTYANVSASAQVADDAAREIEDDAAAVVKEEERSEDEDESLLDNVGDWLADAGEAVGSAFGGALESLREIKDNAVERLNSYMETFALLIVTTCVMPILVMLLFGWIIKLLFSIDISIGSLGRKVHAQASRGVSLVGQGASKLTDQRRERSQP